jgi:hypothetical protein
VATQKEMEFLRLLYIRNVEKEQDKNNNLITQNTELYPRAIDFTHWHTFVITYFELLEALGRLAHLYFKVLLYAVNWEFFYALFSEVSCEYFTADAG